MDRIFNAREFKGQGSLITIEALLRPFADSEGHVTLPGIPNDVGSGMRDPRSILAARVAETRQPTTASIDLKDLGGKQVAIFLRWQINPDIGMPSEPFKVWRRPALPFGDFSAIQKFERNVPPLGRAHYFFEPHFAVTVSVTSPGAAGAVTIAALAGGISFDSTIDIQTLNIPANGQRQVTFYAPHITGLLINGPTQFTVEMAGVPVSAANKIDDWELVETVGIPVNEDRFSDLEGQTHGIKQGLVGAEVTALEAAVQRFRRGINGFGWYPNDSAGGKAPVWEVPEPEMMVEAANDTLLDMLHEAMARPADQQSDFLTTHVIRPPQNPAGKTMPGEDSKAEVSPLKLLQMAVSTDPMQAVILGFGTGYPYEDVPQINLGAISLFGDSSRSDWDYMVTGLWAKEPGGNGKAVERAAIIPRPPLAVRPIPPVDFQHHFLAHQRPVAPDESWRASVRMSWERLPLLNFNPVSSFAAARSDVFLNEPAIPLMEPRPSGKGHMPIGNMEHEDDPEAVRQSASDQGLPIKNDPGFAEVRYSVANQNLFGIWSRWSTAVLRTEQPKPDPVNIISAQLRPIDTGSGTICPADLLVELVVDWRVRSVARIDFRGRLFNAATRHDDPPPTMPAGVQKTVGGAAHEVTIVFAGDAPTLTDASIGLVGGNNVQCLNAQGDSAVAPGFATQGHARRYRVTIPGFSLDYAATPHIAIAMDARLREVIAPGRVGDYGPRATLAYASDPRARPTQVIDIVRLASLPDAGGQCHAMIQWQPVGSAAGYILYKTTETKMLASRGEEVPPPGQTLSQRLTRLRTLYATDPRRNDFTRVNRKLLETTSFDAAIERGSQDIQLFVVVPQGAGGTEAPWPISDNALIPYVAPRLAQPAPPTIEGFRFETDAGFEARLRIGTRPGSGARPTRIDIYRTRVPDAARRLDSMGPPIASITASGSAWSVVTDLAEGATAMEPDVTYITQVTGTDGPEGSWKPYWYRAVAWSSDAPQRGVLGSRGRPSPAISVIVPPADPPPLTHPVLTWPGGDPGAILVTFSAPVPIQPTTLGPHRLSAEVRLNDQDAPLFFTFDPTGPDDPKAPGKKLPGSLPLDLVSEVPPGMVTGLWRLDDGTFRNYRLRIERPATLPGGRVTLRLTDPLGRATERVASFGDGSIIPLPSLTPIDKFTVGRRDFFTTTTDAPLDFRVRITIRLPRTARGRLIGDVPDLRNLRNDNLTLGNRLAGRVAPLPGPILDLGTARRKSQFIQRGTTLTYEAAIADIPRVGSLTIGEQPMFSARRQTTGGQTDLSVIARSPVRLVRFEILLPDGRIVSEERAD